MEHPICNKLSLYTHFASYNKVFIIYDPICEYATNMIKEYYSGPEYDGTLFLLTPCDGFDFNISRPITRGLIKDNFGFEASRVIFLNLDHFLGELGAYYLGRLNEYLQQIDVDEIWEWQVENFINNRYSLKDRVKFMPLRYVSWYDEFNHIHDNIYDPIKHDYLFTFIGNFNPRRLAALDKFVYQPYKIISGHKICDVPLELENGGFVLNIHSSPSNGFREQLRIDECLCMGVPVMTERDSYPYYPNLTAEYEYNDIIEHPDEVISFMEERYEEYRRPKKDISREFKRLTHTNESYENYKNNILNTTL